MRIYEIITKTNTLILSNSSEKKKYMDEVWDLLVNSYKGIGGFKSYTSAEEMANEKGEWVIVLSEDDTIFNVIVSKFSNGKKMVALGSIDSPEAKKISEF